MQSEGLSSLDASDLKEGGTYVRYWPNTSNYAQAFQVLEVTKPGVGIEWRATEQLKEGVQTFLPYEALDSACQLYRLADYQALVNSGKLPPGNNRQVHDKIMQMKA